MAPGDRIRAKPRGFPGQVCTENLHRRPGLLLPSYCPVLPQHSHHNTTCTVHITHRVTDPQTHLCMHKQPYEPNSLYPHMYTAHTTFDATTFQHTGPDFPILIVGSPGRSSSDPQAPGASLHTWVPRYPCHRRPFRLLVAFQDLGTDPYLLFSSSWRTPPWCPGHCFLLRGKVLGEETEVSGVLAAMPGCPGGCCPFTWSLVFSDSDGLSESSSDGDTLA